MMHKCLFLFFFLVMAEVHGQWDSSPFDYFPVKASSSSRYEYNSELDKAKEQNPKRVPASVQKPKAFQLQVKPRKKKTKKPRKVILSSKKNKVDPNWEVIKDKFNTKQEKQVDRKPSAERIEPQSSAGRIQKDPAFNASVASGFFNLDSSSSYFPKNYSAESILVEIKSSFQMKKTWRAYLEYQQSIGLSIKDDNAATNTVSVDHSVLEFGVKRPVQTDSNRSQIHYLLGFREWLVSMPRSANYRLGHKLSSVVLGLNFSWETKEKNSWEVDLKLYPMSNYGVENTSWTASAGEDPEAWGQELAIAYKVALSKQLQLKFKYSYAFENLVFDGSTAAADPVGGSTLNRVNVDYKRQNLGIDFSWSY